MNFDPPVAGWLSQIIAYGQSNSTPTGWPDPGQTVGVTHADPCPGRAFRFVGGVAPNNSSLHPANFSVALKDEDVVGLAPLDFALPLSKGLPTTLESPLYGFADVAHAIDPDLLGLYVSIGVPGVGIEGRKKGTAPFNNLVGTIAAGRERARDLGLRHRISHVLIIDGESEAQSETYSARETRLISDIRDAIEASNATLAYTAPATRFLMTQMSNWTYDPLAPPTGKSVMGQLDIHRAGVAKIVTPNYILEHWGSNLHTTAYGRRVQGEYFAHFAADPDREPLAPAAIEANGDVVTLSFSGRIGELQFNEFDSNANPGGVVDPGNKGFNIHDAGGGTITAVEIVKSGTQINLTLDRAPAIGFEVGYADMGVPGSRPGPTRGPRGCVSDSATTAPSARLVEYRRAALGWSAAAASAPLVNWLVHFRNAGVLIS